MWYVLIAIVILIMLLLAAIALVGHLCVPEEVASDEISHFWNGEL
jgi:hypothetical protein